MELAADDSQIFKLIRGEFNERLIQHHRFTGIETGDGLIGRGEIIDVATDERNTGAELRAQVCVGIEADANASARPVLRGISGAAKKELRAKADVTAEIERAQSLDFPFQVADALVRASRLHRLRAGRVWCLRKVRLG